MLAINVFVIFELQKYISLSPINYPYGILSITRLEIYFFCRLFEKMDKNGDRYISTEELEAFILGLQIQEVGLCEKDFVSKMMEEFDVTGDFHICELEFIHGLSRWLHKANTYVRNQAEDYKNSNIHRNPLWHDFV